MYIDYIEKSEEWTQNSCSISSPSEPIAYSNQFNWGLDRIDEQPYPISGWDYTPSGKNIYLCLLDSDKLLCHCLFTPPPLYIFHHYHILSMTNSEFMKRVGEIGNVPHPPPMQLRKICYSLLPLS